MNCNPKSCETNWSHEPGVLIPSQHHCGSKAGHSRPGQPLGRSDSTNHVQTQISYGYLQPPRHRKRKHKCLSVKHAGFINMCFGSKPNCAWLFYHCLFLSFTAFISYPHQTCEHCEGWVTQIVLLSGVKSIIRQQNPLISLLFRVPIQALKEKGTSQRNFSNYPLPSIPQMLFCMI